MAAASIRRRNGGRSLVLLSLVVFLAVNSGMTAAWLTPTTTSVTTSSVHSNSASNSNRPFRRPILPNNGSSSSSSNHHLKHTAPRRALEVMSDGDQHHSSSPFPQPPPEESSSSSQQPQTRTDKTTTPTTSHSDDDPTALTVMAQLQSQQSLSHHNIQNHPLMQRILGEDDDLSLQQKVINLVFLSAAFGYAIYTIFNIDSGMTRGWTMQEQVMRIPLDNWGAYESYLANKPIITKTLINVIIYLLGDWLSQTAFQGKHVLNFDISRTLRNGFIGLCFGPLVHQYYEFSDAILPPENGMVTRLEKIFMDQTIYLTVKCSIYISAVGLLAGEDWSTVKQTVKDKIVGVVLTAWKFWPIVHCITYSLIPAQHRILWVNCVDLVWNAILASQAQRKESVFEEVESDEEDELLNPAMSAFGEPLAGSAMAATNDTAVVIIDDVGADQFNSNSTTSSSEAVAVP